MREELDSAMGPDEEPGEAKPAPASASQGLGGPGTEGKPGNPEGGTEPELRDVPGPPVSGEAASEEFERLMAKAKRRLKEEDDPPPMPKGFLETITGPVEPPEPRTGVGTPGDGAEAAGIALGGDSGDVNAPRIPKTERPFGSPGGTGGPNATPVASEVLEHQRIPREGKYRHPGEAPAPGGPARHETS